MARIAGVDIPKHKRGVIALTYIFGVGKSRAQDILEKAGVSEDKKVNEWNDDEIGKIREAVGAFKIEGELRSEVQLSIKRLMDIGCYPSQSGTSVTRTKDQEQLAYKKRKT